MLLKTGAAVCTERKPFPVAGKPDGVFDSER